MEWSSSIGATFAAIGRRLHVSREYVRQVVAKHTDPHPVPRSDAYFNPDPGRPKAAPLEPARD